MIEFYGDIWHGNPTIFNENDVPFSPLKDITCKVLWDRDEKRINILKNRGYNILIVWEKEYNDNKDIILEKCKNFLLGN